jgi:hypothetical protein
VLEEALQNPYAYRLKPRLATAMQLLQTTDTIGRQMEDFDLPVIVLQVGGRQGQRSKPDRIGSERVHRMPLGT